MARVLVAGGAGYVGSSACAWLLDQGHQVWVIDDFSTGHRELLLPGIEGFLHARIGDRETVRGFLSRERFDCAFQFAAFTLVSESVLRPAKYFANNVDQCRVFVEELLAAGTKRLVFSSTCAIFGDSNGRPLDEGLPKAPLNPYGETKLKMESILEGYSRSHGLQAVALRYFNAAGAEPGNRTGEWHEPESHLIPRVLQAAAAGAPIEVYGTDYPTRDGTCVRDYIHVSDLAEAHGRAMEKLLGLPAAEGAFLAYNLGTESGSTVREVIAACESATGKKLEVVEKPRRPGDASILVADSKLAKRELGFNPKRNLQEIVSSAWAWEKKREGIRRRAIFLDRDGTINEDPGYLSHPSQLKLLEGAAEALEKLKNAGFVLIVVSNQSGVARGLIDQTALPEIHDRLGELLRERAASIDGYELCLHHPNEDCDCRKPKPKLLLDGARRFGIDLSRSYMIGDKLSDIGAGKSAGVAGSILVRTGEGKEAERGISPGAAAFVADSLKQAADWILDRESAVL